LLGKMGGDKKTKKSYKESRRDRRSRSRSPSRSMSQSGDGGHHRSGRDDKKRSKFDNSLSFGS